jgi:RimJ/RimL family protein N-acetyltransferase
MVEIETERLLLRELRADDVDALAVVLSDPQTMVHYPRPFEHHEVGRWIERSRRSYAERGHGSYAVMLRSSGELVGDCGFLLQQVEGAAEVELGYHVGRAHWSRGYATEAASACRDHAFGPLGLARFISLIRPVNLASLRVAEKTGLRFQREVDFAGLPHHVYAIAAGT